MQEEDTKKKSELGVEEVVGRENRGTGIGVCGKEEGKKCPCCVVMEVWWMTSARLRWSSSTYSAESHPAIQVLVQRFVFFGSNERGDFVRNRNVADANWDNENERGENRVIIGKCLLMLSDSDNL